MFVLLKQFWTSSPGFEKNFVHQTQTRWFHI